MLDEQGIESLRLKHGAVGVVEYNGHQLLFRRPSREEAREWRRKEASAAEQPDAADYLSQLIMVAFDGDTDGLRARTAYGLFLTEHPLFTLSTKFRIVFNLLTGRVEREDIADMGKGVSVRLAPPARTATASLNGSVVSSTESHSPTTQMLQPNS